MKRVTFGKEGCLDLLLIAPTCVLQSVSCISIGTPGMIMYHIVMLTDLVVLACLASLKIFVMFMCV